MNRFAEKFEKFDRIVRKIEFLTDQVVGNPLSEELKKKLKKAEERLYIMIEKEEKEIDRLLESLNEEPEWEE
ncbi:MAG TPA: hypothetical protein VNW99_07910 [Cytophagaceae bacterium]|jgi:exonuclease VII small subunit|nr:hypothetical protein [Cytophagaceae bacterium]